MTINDLIVPELRNGFVQIVTGSMFLIGLGLGYLIWGRKKYPDNGTRVYWRGPRKSE